MICQGALSNGERIAATLGGTVTLHGSQRDTGPSHARLDSQK